jgi:hypothetical protein
MPGIQVEQAVLNLALLLIDGGRGPGTLIIQATKPDKHDRADGNEAYAAAVTIRTAGRRADFQRADEAGEEPAMREGGVILSVVRSMVEEARGRLESRTGADGRPMYRLWLPFAPPASRGPEAATFPAELGAYMAGWSVLLARPESQHRELEDRLSLLGVNVQRCRDIVSVLAHVENGRGWDLLVMDEILVRSEPRGLLKAILKLCPSCGIVVLRDGEAVSANGMPEGIVAASSQTPAESILMAMIDAKSLAAGRTGR